MAYRVLVRESNCRLPSNWVDNSCSKGNRSDWFEGMDKNSFLEQIKETGVGEIKLVINNDQTQSPRKAHLIFEN